MTRIIAAVSLWLAVVSFAYMFTDDMVASCLYGTVSVIAIIVGYWLEALFKTKGNDSVNKIIYYLTPSDKRYNLISKRFTYSYLGNNEYAFKKEYELYPTCNDLDRMNDRFSWSAPSSEAAIKPTISTHEINDKAQKDMWTYFTVYFNESCRKHIPYKAGALIDNLVDTANVAVPYLSAKITRKTKRADLVIKIPQSMNPRNCKFKIYSSKNDEDEIYSMDLEYDASVGGYSRTVEFPRKGWMYVISWDI